mmetsp:Transcript_14034/g.32697  ORF Transcript_14034/g.32697 Transcript_14034/m.32697 type:complete len:130 (+) Transcript_14034:48-437(+)|eukprot:CAMPEP_0182559804 /NCGR_PEP_ID=MMETSP1324-20130603/2790_1 /TAXON_ID=236786 /ORGANISM="Florenciella sp., Strain RCC1587" /LENGTH=129 /DNA_ID=CAMNT_0024772111 /DNA_START=46 /DNA_END=435 /DNA_ORIENTATION=-
MRSFVAAVLLLLAAPASALVPQGAKAGGAVDRRQALSTAFSLGATVVGITAAPKTAQAIREVTYPGDKAPAVAEDLSVYNSKPPTTKAEKARARKAEEKKELMSKLEGTNTAVTRGQLKKNGLYERIAL